MSTATQRTMDHFRSLGYDVWMVERWLMGARKRVDLLNIIDMLAFREGHAILGIQSTATDFGGHVKKIAENSDNLELWLSTGAQFALVGWRKLKVKRGGKAVRWTPRIKYY